MKMTKFSKQVENAVGKGEIAHNEQFLLFPVFSRLVLQTRENQGLFGKGLTIYCKQQTFDDPWKEAF